MGIAYPLIVLLAGLPGATFLLPDDSIWWLVPMAGLGAFLFLLLR